MTRSFAAQHKLLEGDIAMLQQELVDLRGHYWRTKFALDDATAHLGARKPEHSGEDAGNIDDEEEEDFTVQDGVRYLLDRASMRDERGERFYYPTSITKFPPELRERMTQESFRRIIDSVKEARRTKRKAVEMEEEEVEGEASIPSNAA